MDYSRVFPVAEHFVSINGEGSRAGRLAAFIRMAGCNLACSWCDTSWANEDSCQYESLNVDQLVSWVASSGVSCVTLTGGEPTLQPGLANLIDSLARSDEWGRQGKRVIEIETNGSVDLSGFDQLRKSLASELPRTTTIAFTVDCKMPSSGMFLEMLDSNYNLLCEDDVVKFVVASSDDLQTALERIDEFDLCERCEVFFSPVFSCIEPSEIVAFMQEHALYQVRLQLQLHKIIWPNVEKGV